jgi:glutamyl-tRNA synthetase
LDAIEECVRAFADANGVTLGAVAQPLRAALTGSVTSPGIFAVMEFLGRDETFGRIADAAEGA